jgi:hypothetical protein
VHTVTAQTCIHDDDGISALHVAILGPANWTEGSTLETSDDLKPLPRVPVGFAFDLFGADLHRWPLTSNA